MQTKQEVIKLLMVDDEAILFQGVKRVLANKTITIPELDSEIVFEQSWAGSGEEFFEKLETQSPDLVFLDYKLPQMSGLDVLNKLNTVKHNSLVVMITAFANLETAIKATKLGAFDFLAKPFSPEELRYVAKKAAQQIILSRRAKNHEEEKKKIRFEFLSVLAHELKAPLNAIEGYLDILKDRLVGQDAMMIERSLIRLDGARKLIFDLLDLTRIESGQKTRIVEQVNLISVINHVLEGLETDISHKHLTIILPKETEFIFNIDHQEFEIIANNLISNAVKYNCDNGSIEIFLERNANQMTFKVKDSGIGMTEEETKKLFQEFMRIRNEKTTNILGSGLGLSTVKKLAKLYAGDAFVESEPGKGSMFIVLLQSS